VKTPRKKPKAGSAGKADLTLPPLKIEAGDDPTPEYVAFSEAWIEAVDLEGGLTLLRAQERATARHPLNFSHSDVVNLRDDIALKAAGLAGLKKNIAELKAMLAGSSKKETVKQRNDRWQALVTKRVAERVPYKAARDEIVMLENSLGVWKIDAETVRKNTRKKPKK
jgi:hypothetical protein